MLRRSRIYLVICVGLALVAAACGEAQPDLPDATVSVLPTPDESISVLPTPHAQSVLPTPEGGVEVPTPPEDAVTVYGQLLLMDPTSVAPEEDGLYLVPIEAEGDEEGVSFAVPRIDDVDSVLAVIDEVTGRFYFEEVAAGMYALVARTDTGMQVAIRDFDDGNIVYVTVNEADVGTFIDMGRLRL